VTGPGRRPTPRAWAEVALVVVVVFCAALAGFQWHRAHHAQSRLNDDQAALAARDEVASTAAAAGTALFTYDYRDLAATQQRIRSLATGAFAQRESASTSAVEGQLRAAKAVGSATVSEETVSAISAGRATALVILDTKASSATGASTTGTVYLHIDLQDVEGTWKVDDVQTLAPRT
jgi:hypothetical protein